VFSERELKSIEQKVNRENKHIEVTELAEKLYINSLSIPHPEGTLNGIDLDSDYVGDQNGFSFKHPHHGWLSLTNTRAKEGWQIRWTQDILTKGLPFPKWHRDEYGSDRRLIRECYHRAELFYSTVEKLQE